MLLGGKEKGGKKDWNGDKTVLCCLSVAAVLLGGKGKGGDFGVGKSLGKEYEPARFRFQAQGSRDDYAGAKEGAPFPGLGREKSKRPTPTERIP